MESTANTNSFRSGCDDASSDIAAGKLRYYFGTRGGWGEFCHALMQSRFGVLVESTSCFVTADLLAYREGYNSTIATYIDRVFGSGAFQSALDEVWKFRKEQYDAYFKNKLDSDRNGSK